MIRLVLVELTRLRWRRAVVLLLLLAVAVPAIVLVSRILTTQPLSESEIADIRASSAPEIARCVEHPRRYGAPAAGGERTERVCERTVIGWQTDTGSLTLASERTQGPGIGVVAILTAVLLLAGTTFVGHDWNSGSMSNQLLFESRRGRVWAAKATAVTVVALVLALAVSTAYWLGVWGVMRWRDLPVAEGGLTDSLAFGWRGAGFAAAAALGGYALTTLFRSTVATIGVLFAVAVAGGLLIAVLGIGEQWQPQKNVGAIVKDGTTYYVDVPDSCYAHGPDGPGDGDGACDPQRDLSVWRGIGYYGAALVLTCGASAASFRRRDVP